MATALPVIAITAGEPAGIGAETIDWEGGFRGPWLYAVFGLASWLTAGGYIAMKDGGTRGPE